MNKIALLGMLVTASLAASAQAQMGPMQDPYGDATVTKADSDAAAAKRFTEMDTNKDGFLSADELGRMARMIDRADKNGDGKLNRDEFISMQQQRFDMMDADHDGKLTKAERDAFRQQMMERMRSMQGGGGAGGAN